MHADRLQTSNLSKDSRDGVIRKQTLPPPNPSKTPTWQSKIHVSTTPLHNHQAMAKASNASIANTQNNLLTTTPTAPEAAVNHGPKHLRKICRFAYGGPIIAQPSRTTTEWIRLVSVLPSPYSEQNPVQQSRTPCPPIEQSSINSITSRHLHSPLP